MKTEIKSFIKSLNELPDNRYPPEFFTPTVARSYIFGIYAYIIGLGVHFFLAIFTIIGIKVLAIFNILSVFLWGIAVVLQLKGYFWQAYLSVCIELISHAAICTVII